ncbi:hypothetical protein [Tabrizicola sp.]|uniref:hypothetical protein n=1 Tax=Tabrizicola sp. TaxID=2005166 RepID=UPI003F3C1521
MGGRSISEIVAEFAARPWAAVGDAEMAAGLAVPSMLTHEESQLYHWLGRRAEGQGATVDLGAYAGGSAARLLSGLAVSGQSYQVHSYDRFRSSRAFWARYMPEEPLPATDDADLLPLVRRHLAPWGDRVTLYPGDIGEMRWTGGPIEILSVDAAKGSAMADHIAAQFFPALVPGRSILVQQDYLMSVQPWISAQMVALADHFVPLAKVAKVCVVFLCVKPVTEAALQAARTDTLTDGALMKRVRAAADWHEGMIRRAQFKAMLSEIKANPGVRLGWQMRHAGRLREGGG